MPLVRDLTLEDLDGLLALYTHLHPADAPTPRDTAERIWQELIASPHHIYLGIDADTRLAASLTATIIPNLTRGARPYAVIENVITHPDHRRQGFGRALLEAALDRCWDAGCYKVMLQSGARRSEAHAFYESVGFDPDAKQAFLAKPPR